MSGRRWLILALLLVVYLMLAGGWLRYHDALGNDDRRYHVDTWTGHVWRDTGADTWLVFGRAHDMNPRSLVNIYAIEDRARAEEARLERLWEYGLLAALILILALLPQLRHRTSRVQGRLPRSTH